MSRRDKAKIITASRQHVFLVLFPLIFGAAIRSPSPNVNGRGQPHLRHVRQCHSRRRAGVETRLVPISPMGAGAYYERMTSGGGETNGTANEWAFYPGPGSGH
jgi:hypothetical protein